MGATLHFSEKQQDIADCERSEWTWYRHYGRNADKRLQHELPEQQFNTWIRPLQAREAADHLCLVAPNRFICDFVSSKYEGIISRILEEEARSPAGAVTLEIATEGRSAALTVAEAPPPVSHGPRAELTPVPERRQKPSQKPSTSATPSLADTTLHYGQASQSEVHEALQHQHNLVSGYTFGNFVEGKSNQLALAAAHQVAENPGGAYNPLFLYGGVGLGKTHLMHAVGNALKVNKPNARIVYLHSERFVADMVKALQLNAIADFKRYYRSVDALLIDDIQFFARKDRSQEEFFHTFNALLEGGQQMILTCDRYPKEIELVWRSA